MLRHPACHFPTSEWFGLVVWLPNLPSKGTGVQTTKSKGTELLSGSSSCKRNFSSKDNSPSSFVEWQMQSCDFDKLLIRGSFIFPSWSKGKWPEEPAKPHASGRVSFSMGVPKNYCLCFCCAFKPSKTDPPPMNASAAEH